MQTLLNVPFSNIKKIHFVGIGGIGMSGIAALFHELGFIIQGSDVKEGPSIETLRDIGIKVFIGHNKENIGDSHMIVVSSAIKEDNEEYAEALALGLPIFKRGKMLAELMRFKWGIAVAGTHGKTTTTSIVSHVLKENNYDPTAIIGGIVNAWGNNSRFGESNWLVAESDESDGSFLDLPATISIVTNIEAEHMDHYKDYRNLEAHFIEFINHIPFYGFSVLCIDNVGVQNILPFVKKRKIITYGLSPQADYRAVNIHYNGKGAHFDVICQYKGKAKTMKDFYLPMYGDHNILNCLSAIIVAENIGISEDKIKNSISSFSGVKRRFTGVGAHKDIKFIDDYAHHPSEIEAVINSANQIIKGKNKVVTIVQPHRYTRLRDHFDGFCKCFNKADIVFVLDVYSAGEKPIENINSENLAKGIANYGHKNVRYIKNSEDIIENLNQVNSQEDVEMVIFMGAGDITYIAQKTFNKFSEK